MKPSLGRGSIGTTGVEHACVGHDSSIPYHGQDRDSTMAMLRGIRDMMFRDRGSNQARLAMGYDVGYTYAEGISHMQRGSP